MSNVTFFHEYPNCAVSYIPDYNSVLGLFAAETVQAKACANGNFTSLRDSSYYAFENIVYINMIAFAGLVGVIYVNCRSRLGVKYVGLDWFTLTLFYIMGTLGLVGIFFFNLELGITKLEGFGSLVHNSAEVYLLLFVFFGKNKLGLNSINEIGLGEERFYSNHLLYVWFAYSGFLLILIVILPINLLFLIALIIGFIVDFLLAISFLMISKKYKAIGSKKAQYASKSYGIASFGLFVHVLASISYGGFFIGSVYFLTVGALLFTVEFYTFTIFAIREHKRSKFCGSYDGKFLLKQVNQDNDVLFKCNKELDVIGGGGTSGKTDDKASMDSVTVYFESGALSEGHIVNFTKMQLIIIFVISVICSIIYALLIWFSPCYLPKDWMCVDY